MCFTRSFGVKKTTSVFFSEWYWQTVRPLAYFHTITDSSTTIPGPCYATTTKYIFMKVKSCIHHPGCLCYFRSHRHHLEERQLTPPAWTGSSDSYYNIKKQKSTTHKKTIVRMTQLWHPWDKSLHFLLPPTYSPTLLLSTMVFLHTVVAQLSFIIFFVPPQKNDTVKP